MALTVHYSKVQIYDGVCDSCDLCGIKTCRFYDTSREATCRFQFAQAKEHTMEGLLEEMQQHSLLSYAFEIQERCCVIRQALRKLRRQLLQK